MPIWRLSNVPLISLGLMQVIFFCEIGAAPMLFHYRLCLMVLEHHALLDRPCDQAVMLGSRREAA